MVRNVVLSKILVANQGGITHLFEELYNGLANLCRLNCTLLMLILKKQECSSINNYIPINSNLWSDENHFKSSKQ